MSEPIVNQPVWGSKPTPFAPVVHSYSSMVMFENCPWRWFQDKVKKSIKFEQTEQMREGDIRHRALEAALKHNVRMPEKYAGDQPIIDAIRNTPGTKLAEWQFGLTKNWTETTFFAKDVWVRGKIDAGVVGTKAAVILDYKTGKVKDDYDQLALFAIPAFVRWPSIDVIKTSYLWLGNNQTSPATFHREDLPKLKENVAFKTFRIEDALKSGNEKRFPKIPSGLCRRHCPVPRALCEFQCRSDI